MNDRSPLIDEALAAQLTELFGKLQTPVVLHAQLDDGPKSREMETLLNHLSGLSDLLTWEKSPETDTLMPCTGIAPAGETPRMFFHGIPGGREIGSFAAAILNAGGAGKPLDKYTLKDIGKIKKPMELQVCVSLGCHHCAQLVAAAQRVALENPLVTAHMIDANLYPELVKSYQIERVPLLIVNREQTFPGGKTMAELTTLLAKIK